MRPFPGWIIAAAGVVLMIGIVLFRSMLMLEQLTNTPPGEPVQIAPHIPALERHRSRVTGCPDGLTLLHVYIGDPLAPNPYPVCVEIPL